MLGDLCSAGGGFSNAFAKKLGELTGDAVGGGQAEKAVFHDSIVLLRHNFRFGKESGIGKAAELVNAGQGDEALSVLQRGASDASWFEAGSIEALQREVAVRAASGYEHFAQKIRAGADPGAVLRAFAAFRVLSAHRQGPSGVERLNELIERELHARRLILAREAWYAGRPVIITRNDYNLKLYNGDVGVALPDPAQGGRLAVYCQSSDGTVRHLSPARLPDHETVYAMTVHKSQGSEFERVLFVLPPEPSPVLTRELIYTGLTRAREALEVLGRSEVFSAAVATPTKRASGLRERLLET